MDAAGGPPVRISDLVGNESLIRLLAKAELPQASLFTGPSGIGKKTIAVCLAALANCHAPVAGDLCGVCPSCLKVDSGNHPDVSLVNGPWIEAFVTSRKKRFNPQVIPIDVAREIVRQAQYRPYEGKIRVFVIDEAEKLNESAANALLKTLEEPPESCRIILVSAYPNRLLPTIRSRCQTFAFRPLSREAIRRYLERTIEPGRARLVAAFADGSIGSALSLDLEQALQDREAVLELLSGWISKGSFANLHFALEREPLRKDLKNRERALTLLDRLQMVCQDLYFLLAGTPERVIGDDRVAELEDLASRISLDWLEAFLYHLRDARRDIERYVNTQLCFETLWLKSQLGHVEYSDRQI